MAHLPNAIKHCDLIGEGATFNIDFEKLKLEEEEARNIEEIETEDYYSNANELLLEDEDLYNGVDSFEDIASKMINVTENGDLKKSMIRPGYGDVIKKEVEVCIDYNAFFEYNVEPFDSTYARKKPHRFTINDGTVIKGLNLAVQTMKINEKAQFLIKPSLAFGKYGCCGRIPPNSTVLFEIELKKSYNVIPTNVSVVNKNTFDFMYNYAEVLNSEGKQYFQRKQYTRAIRKYNIAVGKLESCVVSDITEQEKQQEFLIKLYSNIVVCYMLLEKPKQACFYANKGINLDSRSPFSAKLYYNKAKCLKKLGEYTSAEKFLKIAHEKCPGNNEIAEEFKKLEEAKNKFLKEQAIFAARCMKDYGGISVEFKTAVIKGCDDLNKNESVEFVISKKLSDSEKSFIMTEVKKRGLTFKTIDDDGNIKNIIGNVKPEDDW